MTGTDELLTAALLYDCYGELLTAKQRECYELYHLQDLSLAEIGEIQQTTPQAVRDLLKRTEALLSHYESCLHLVEQYLKQQDALRQIYDDMRRIADETGNAELQAMPDRIQEVCNGF